MQHLSIETLARLVDEGPSVSEREHLASCAACRAELDALGDQKVDLRELPALQPPAGGWDQLQAALEREGLIASGAPMATSGHGWGWRRHLPRIAAGIALFVTGGVAGAAMTTGSAGDGSSLARLTDGREGPAVAEVRTVAEAAETLEQAETAYLTALGQYAELSGEPVPVDVATRLATLESIVLTTRAALDEAPADPVINTYHLTALGQRNAMLRQIAQQSQDPWF